MIAKRHVVTEAQEVVDLAMQAVGGSAYFKTSPLEQAYRDVRAGLFHPHEPGAHPHSTPAAWPSACPRTRSGSDVDGGARAIAAPERGILADSLAALATGVSVVVTPGRRRAVRHDRRFGRGGVLGPPAAGRLLS